MRNEIFSLIGCKVKALRIEQSRTAEDLAERSDLDSSWIEALESGARPIRIDEVFRVSAALGVPVMTLFSSDGLVCH